MHKGGDGAVFKSGQAVTPVGRMPRHFRTNVGVKDRRRAGNPTVGDPATCMFPPYWALSLVNSKRPAGNPGRAFLLSEETPNVERPTPDDQRFNDNRLL